MNPFVWILDPSFSVRLTTALLHFLWQGCCGGMLVLIGTVLLRQAPSRWRYTLNVCALFILLLCLPITFSLIEVPGGAGRDQVPSFGDSPAGLSLGAVTTLSGVDPQSLASSFDSSAIAEPLIAPSIVGGALVESSNRSLAVNSPAASDLMLTRWFLIAPWVVALYLVCVALILVRLLKGVWGSYRLRQWITLIEDAAILNEVTQQAQRLGLRVAPVIAWCEQITVPVVVGIIKPMVLLPIEVVSGLTSHQLQALLLHELAHIRRFDPVVNLIQRTIEAVLFFHPVVWYVSRQISIEREHAADDMVLAVGWDRPLYADALVRMAELSSRMVMPEAANGISFASQAMCMSATGTSPSEFKRRVLRLLDDSGRDKFQLTRGGMLATLLTVVTLFSTLVLVQARANNYRTNQASADTTDADVEPGNPSVVAQKPSPPAPPVHLGPYVADFRGGLQVEFVGITPNTAPAKAGWKPDGRPLGEKVGYWKSTIVLHDKNSSSAYSENGTHPEPDPEALDFLFRFRGLKAQPSIRFELPANGSSMHNYPVRDPYEVRVSTRRRGDPGPGATWSVPDGRVMVGFTDEPWGRYVKVSPAGQVLNPIQPDDQYSTTYMLIQVVGAEPHDRAPSGQTVLIRAPSGQTDPEDPLHRYAFEFRAIDTEGGSHWALEWQGRGIENSKLVNSQWGLAQPLPEGKTLSHYEYRVRPFRHWITLTGVSLTPGQISEVKVQSRSLKSIDTSNAAESASTTLEAEVHELLRLIPANDGVRRVEALIEFATTRHQQGNRNAALRLLELAEVAALAIPPQTPDPAGFPGIWSQSGALMSVCIATARLDGIPAALRRAEKISTPHFRVIVLCVLADLQREAKDPEGARKSLAVALDATRSVTDIPEKLVPRFVNKKAHRVSSYERVATGYAQLGDFAMALDVIAQLARVDRPVDCWGALHEVLKVQVIHGNGAGQSQVLAAIEKLAQAKSQDPEMPVLEARQNLDAVQIRRSAMLAACQELLSQVKLEAAGQVIAQLKQEHLDKSDSWRVDGILLQIAQHRIRNLNDETPLPTASDFNHRISFLTLTALHGRELALRGLRTRAIKLCNTVVAEAKDLPANNQPKEALIIAAQGYAILGNEVQAFACAELVPATPDVYVAGGHEGFYALHYQPMACRATAIALIARSQLERDAIDQAKEAVNRITLEKAPDGTAQSWYLERVKAHALAEIAARLSHQDRHSDAQAMVEAAETPEIRIVIANRLKEYSQQKSAAVLPRQRNEQPQSKTETDGGLKQHQEREVAAASNAVTKAKALVQANAIIGVSSVGAQVETITGTVVSINEQPVSGIEVLVFQSAQQLPEKFVTDAKGQFQVPKAWRTTEHYLTLVARDGRDRIGWFDFFFHAYSDNGQKSADGAFRIVLLPINHTVRGRLTDASGNPLAKIPLRIEYLQHETNFAATHWKYQSIDGESLIQGGLTDAEGWYEVKLPADTFAWLGSENTDWVVPRIQVPRDTDQLRPAKVTQAAKVAGRVTDSRTGKPLAGVFVSAQGLNPKMASGLYGETKTDVDGRYLIGGLANDQFSIQISKIPFKTLVASTYPKVELTAGETFIADFELAVGKRLTGQVIDRTTGQAVPACKVTCSGVGTNLTIDTDSKGEFEFYVSPGLWTVDAGESRLIVDEQSRQIEVLASGDPDPVVLKVAEMVEKGPLGLKIFVGPPLDRKVSLDARRMSLENALTQVCQAAAVKLELDSDGLKFHGYTRNMPVSMELKGITLRDAMSRILRPYEKLSFTFDEKQNQVYVSSLDRVATRDRAQARPETSPPKGLEFLKSYPKLHELSLDMTEQQFLDIVKQQELQPLKTMDGGNTEYIIATDDDHSVIVMFDSTGKNCRGIQRLRGTERELKQKM